jgi:hypothetical protein
LANENSKWKSTDPTPTRLVFGAPPAPPAPPREKWLFIAWVFGREQVLKDLASILVREISTYSKGTCAALAVNYGPMPPGLIGLLTSLFGIAFPFVPELIFSTESILVCRQATIARLLAITAKCVSPFTDDPNALLPLNYGSYVAQDHSNCFTTDIKKEVEAVIAGIGDPVLEDHYFHMRVQQAKLRGVL